MKFKLPKLQSEKLIELTKKLFQDRHAKALQDLKELENQNPDDMRLRQRIAEAYYKQGRTEEAAEAFRVIAEHYEKEDFVIKAIDAYKNMIKIRPELVEINLRLTALYLKVGMKMEAANQYRIAINHHARAGDTDKTLALAKQLVEVDPSGENRAKLAEIYQSCRMSEEAVKQYEILAKEARLKKNYDKLLHFYELILPHRPNNTVIIKDLCILYLRRKQPERALHIIEQYKVGSDPVFGDLSQKAKLMLEAMKRQKK